ncbi:recombinase family protein [Cryptosporangium minutisporangium]|uniref:Recombinase family protein n=1 Tax=Cryptosporangium minutisporangium TaxID=113569 RepID=A0ABP6SNP8_9ACTN
MQTPAASTKSPADAGAHTTSSNRVDVHGLARACARRDTRAPWTSAWTSTHRHRVKGDHDAKEHAPPRPIALPCRGVNREPDPGDDARSASGAVAPGRRSTPSPHPISHRTARPIRGVRVRFAFAGRVSTEDQQDPEASRLWQRSRSEALIAPVGGEIVAEFFDVGMSRSLPWSRRPRAAGLLAALRDAGRGFEAVVIGEPQRAFYGNQFGLTFPLFVHYGVELWVPEVGGAIDPGSDAHDLVMQIYGGMSKGERSRIKIRVRSTMAAQAATEGRFLGGRPPYGYRLADAGPHPNPAKAADGKRLHVLELDPVAAPIVVRIFAEYLDGRGFFAIAQGLTRDGIPCPSAHDRKRNSHRTGVAWSKSAVRAILLNPRYTGREVWNKQRKDEVLIDVEDVALGHETKMRWNDRDTWIWSAKPTHPAIVTPEDFEGVQALTAAGARRPNVRKTRTMQRHYLFSGRVRCGLCGRLMQGNFNNGRNHYRCRYPADYAAANHVEHPKAVYLREDVLAGPVDEWLTQAFAPAKLTETLTAMSEAEDSTDDTALAAAKETIQSCGQRLQRYRAALEAGTDPALIQQWTAEVQAERVQAEAKIRELTGRQRMTTEEINALVNALGGIRRVLIDADPIDRAQVYRSLNLDLTYHPGRRTVTAEARPEGHVLMGCVRGGT